MQNIQIIIAVCVILSVSPALLGRVQKARLLPGLKNQSVWLLNQSNASICLCTAIKLYKLSNLAALNVYMENKTCQVILSPPVLSPKIFTDNKCTLILLQPLTDAPCCSDTSWLLYRIQNAKQKFQTTINYPTMLSISSNKKYISTMSLSTRQLVNLYRENISLASEQSLPSGYHCKTAFYRRGYIFFGCDGPAAVVIFNETNLNTPIKQINMDDPVSGISFSRNDSLIFVAVQYTNISLYIYNITWKPSLTVSLVTKFASYINITLQQTWSVNAINDTFALMTTWGALQSVNIIRSPSSTSNIWNISTLPMTQVTAYEYLTDAVIDPCGRIWTIVQGFGIRIFDPSGTVSVGNWTFSNGLLNILILDNYELIMTDYGSFSVYQYKPDFKCNS